MKTALSATIGLAVLVAIAGVAGLALVAPGALTAPFGGSTGGSGGGGGSVGYGTLAVYVKDAPSTVNWTHVWVDFSVIQAHEANASDANGWFNVTVPHGMVDVAALTSVSQLLGSAKLPTGMYTQLRIVVSSATGVMADGTKVNFTVPSTELRTDDPFNITVGQTTSLTIDVDLSRSIVHADGMWLFKPVIGAVTQG